jgi:hypothetical protein
LSIQTPYDYIVNSITWLPLSITILIFVAWVSTAIENMFTAPLDVDLPSRLWFAKAESKIKRLSVIRGMLSLIALIQAYIFRFPSSVLSGTVALLGFGAFLWCVAEPWRWTLPRSQAFAVRIAAITIFSLGSSFVGGEVAAVLAASPLLNEVYAITDKNGERRQVFLLRSLDKGVLIYDPGRHQIAFIRWDQANVIDHPMHWTTPSFSIFPLCDEIEHVFCEGPPTP